MEELERVEIDPKINEKKETNKYDSLREMRDTLQGYRDQALGALYLGCTQTGLNRNLTETALRNTDKTAIEKSSIDTLREFLNSVKDLHSENKDFYSNDDDLSNFKDVLLTLKDLVDQVIECENQLHTINEAIKEVEIAITSDIFSEKFINSRIAEVDRLEDEIKRKLANNEYPSVEATVKARKDLAQCSDLRKTYDLSFVTDNVDYDALINTFMRRMSNDYCFTKCGKVMSKMNFSIAALNSLANLEEQFLDERYKVFNNFFLFHVIRLISYMDPKSKLDCLRVKTLIHGLVGFASGPDKCDYIRNLIERFYEPILKRLEDKDPNALRLAEVNPYTNANAEELDKEIVDKAARDDEGAARSYIKHMILVDGSSSSEEDVDAWLDRANHNDIMTMAEKISLMIKLERFYPKSMSIAGFSFISVEELRKDYAKMNEAYDESIHIEN